MHSHPSLPYSRKYATTLSPKQHPYSLAAQSVSTYDKTLRQSHHRSQKTELKRKKLMSMGFKKSFSLMCIKQFCVMQVTAGICYLAVMGHAQTGLLLIP